MGVLGVAETQVYLLLRKYRVQKHYRASRAAKVTRYAVYANGEQLTEPKTFVEATADRDFLTAKAIVPALQQIVEGE
jgi:hypothetical protein